MFFDFSSAFNTIQPSLLRGKMEGAGQGTVLSPFLFTLYTSDFSHNSDSCHLQKFSDDTAIVGPVSEGNELEYREVITNFVAWCELNHLCINATKTKEVVIDFSRKAPHTAPVNIQGLDIEILEEYKYLGVHLNNKLDWTHNTDALYKKGQSRLHLLRRLRSFGVIFYAVVCWSCGSSERDRKRLNKLVRRAGSVLDCSLDSIDEVEWQRSPRYRFTRTATPPLQVTEGDSSAAVDDKDDKERAQMSRSLLRPSLVNIAGYYPVNGTGSPINGEKVEGEKNWSNLPKNTAEHPPAPPKGFSTQQIINATEGRLMDRGSWMELRI
ncbi:hypothetical protein D4764_16G0004040 [Takifugu flavidus]|uniref:Reverse transcriptase domain-containing protein n=1 Tax=Takifugu flavidus TaxID=433684 RepID=A0A5C6P1E3_9TELE|nr:hypothetical protein D4764_16G0004040 [Takifugu flavidus]